MLIPHDVGYHMVPYIIVTRRTSMLNTYLTGGINYDMIDKYYYAYTTILVMGIVPVLVLSGIILFLCRNAKVYQILICIVSITFPIISIAIITGTAPVMYRGALQDTWGGYHIFVSMLILVIGVVIHVVNLLNIRNAKPKKPSDPSPPPPRKKSVWDK